MGKFLTGLCIGIGLGLFIAPRAGRETRRLLVERLAALRGEKGPEPEQPIALETSSWSSRITPFPQRISPTPTTIVTESIEPQPQIPSAPAGETYQPIETATPAEPNMPAAAIPPATVRTPAEPNMPAAAIPPAMVRTPVETVTPAEPHMPATATVSTPAEAVIPAEPNIPATAIPPATVSTPIETVTPAEPNMPAAAIPLTTVSTPAETVTPAEPNIPTVAVPPTESSTPIETVTPAEPNMPAAAVKPDTTITALTNSTMTTVQPASLSDVPVRPVTPKAVKSPKKIPQTTTAAAEKTGQSTEVAPTSGAIDKTKGVAMAKDKKPGQERGRKNPSPGSTRTQNQRNSGGKKSSRPTS